MSAAGFVHLRVHSEYSIADGLIRLKDLARRAAELSMPAVALTDSSNLYGLMKFHRACTDLGVKPIAGLDLRCPENGGPQAATCHAPADSPGSGEAGLTLLACSAAGYGNLLGLASLAHGDRRRWGTVNREQLGGNAEGLIALSGGRNGEIGRALLRGDATGARRAAEWWAGRFPQRFYVELQRTGRPDEERYLRDVLQLAAELELPVVATNDVCFLDEDDFEAHETRVCIQQGRILGDPRRERQYSSSQYFRSVKEMAVLFADLPEALDNSLEIARRCTVWPDTDETYLPSYPVPEGESLEDYLATEARNGLAERLAEIASLGAGEVDANAYEQRLEYELDVIRKMGFPGYFLVVMEFIAWARRRDIPVGPGRGSGAGSLVAYALRITDLDPIRYDLLFERFLNPERVSLPDFDVDFCMDGRDRVIEHVTERYGRDAVSQIVTFGTMAAKAVVRDVARAQGKPYGLGDRLAKLIPFQVGMTLEKAMQESADLKTFVEEDEEAGEIMDMAFRLEGIVRNEGRHAGGVVIAPGRLQTYVPVSVDEMSSGLVSQFDKDDVERAGLVKFDFLGLKTLTIIDWTVKAVNAQRGDEEPLQIENIPLDDPATYSLLKKAETTGVFQLESRGMKELIRGLKPDNIDDIIASIALFRPGPLQSGAVEEYVGRKHGKERVTYPHPDLEPVLKGTYGVMLYQEQVMETAQVLAGFTLGQADLLRRAMGKKKPEEMEKVRREFEEGAAGNGVDATLANDLFNQMEKFAGYAFNKSHSAGYALVSYQTAWLKANYPAQFMAATLSADMQHNDKVVTLVNELQSMGLPLEPPNVNLSSFRFTVVDGGVVYGLGAVRGVGEGPVEAIEAARASGPFRDLAEFCVRVDAKKANRRVMEALIRCGALDDFARAGESAGAVRARLWGDLDQALQGADQAARNAASGMMDMFGGINTPATPAPSTAGVRPWSAEERLEGEKETLGLYLTGHPIDSYQGELSHFCTRIGALRAGREKRVVGGMVQSLRTRRGRRGDTMGFAVIDDGSGRMEASFFPEVYERDRNKLEKDRFVILEGEVQKDEFTDGYKLVAQRALSVEEARSRFSDGLHIHLRDADIAPDAAGRLKTVFAPHVSENGGCPVSICYTSRSAEGWVRLGPAWSVRGSDELLSQLQSEFGTENVAFHYSTNRPAFSRRH